MQSALYREMLEPFFGTPDKARCGKPSAGEKGDESKRESKRKRKRERRRRKESAKVCQKISIIWT